MSSTPEIKNATTFKEACEIFKGTKPKVFVNFNPKSKNDERFAGKVAEDLIEQGLDVVCATEILPGQDERRELSIGAEECSHMITVASSSTNEEGPHRKWFAITRERGKELTDGHTHNFYLAENEDVRDSFADENKINHALVGTWSSEKQRIKMITAMMTVGPAGRGYFALDSQPHTGYETRRIDWSQERFAYLLGQEVTTQELDVIAPQFVKETHGRYGKLVVVSVDDATYHNSPKIDKAFTFKASAYHGDIARGSSVQCFCGQCGSERTDVFSVDKSSDQTHGTLIVVNKPCASCGFTSNVNPVPEFSLQKALDKIYEK